MVPYSYVYAVLFVCLFIIPLAETMSQEGEGSLFARVPFVFDVPYEWRTIELLISPPVPDPETGRINLVDTSPGEGQSANAIGVTRGEASENIRVFSFDDYSMSTDEWCGQIVNGGKQLARMLNGEVTVSIECDPASMGGFEGRIVEYFMSGDGMGTRNRIVFFHHDGQAYGVQSGVMTLGASYTTNVQEHDDAVRIIAESFRFK